MCRVAVGLYNCGHGRVLVGHPATQRCDRVVGGLCVAENQIPAFNQVSEYILMEGPTQGRIERDLKFVRSIRTNCQLPECNNFRPDVRCVELVVNVLRSRVEHFEAVFAELTKQYQTLDQDLWLRTKDIWFDHEKRDKWCYEVTMSKLHEALKGMEEYYSLCLEFRATSYFWDGLIPNPVGQSCSTMYPRYRCFPGKTFNKAICFTRKANDKFELLYTNLQELRMLQDARNAHRLEEDRRARRPELMQRYTKPSSADTFNTEELFTEHDEMAGIDKYDSALRALERETFRLPPATTDFGPGTLNASVTPNELTSPTISQVSLGFDTLSDSDSSSFAIISDVDLSSSDAISLVTADDEEDDVQPATLSELVASSEPLSPLENRTLSPELSEEGSDETCEDILEDVERHLEKLQRLMERTLVVFGSAETSTERTNRLSL